MPAVKRKPKSKKRAAKKRKSSAKSGRYATGYCRGSCRLRTTGMQVGDVRRRISNDGKKLKVIRVA